MLETLVAEKEKTHEVREHFVTLAITVNEHSDQASQPHHWNWQELLDLDPHESVKIVSHRADDHPFLVDDEGESAFAT